jgi:hypothetical protein
MGVAFCGQAKKKKQLFREKKNPAHHRGIVLLDEA